MAQYQILTGSDVKNLKRGEASWKDLTVAAIEEAGQQESMSWICAVGQCASWVVQVRFLITSRRLVCSIRVYVWLCSGRIGQACRALKVLPLSSSECILVQVEKFEHISGQNQICYIPWHASEYVS